MAPFLRSQRLRMARPYLRGRVLDYGCSSGALAELCRPEAYLGVDISEEALEVARASHPGYEFDNTVSKRAQSARVRRPVPAPQSTLRVERGRPAQMASSIASWAGWRSGSRCCF